MKKILLLLTLSLLFQNGCLIRNEASRISLVAEISEVHGVSFRESESYILLKKVENPNRELNTAFSLFGKNYICLNSNEHPTTGEINENYEYIVEGTREDGSPYSYNKKNIISATKISCNNYYFLEQFTETTGPLLYGPYNDEDISTEDCNTSNVKNACYYIVATTTKDTEICSKIKDAFWNEQCIFAIAKKNKNIDLCDTLSELKTECYSQLLSEAKKEDCLKIQDFDSYTGRECFERLGLKERDITYCEMIKDENNKNYCYDNAIRSILSEGRNIYKNLNENKVNCNNEKVFDNESRRNSCFKELAVWKNDPEICKQIKFEQIDQPKQEKLLTIEEIENEYNSCYSVNGGDYDGKCKKWEEEQLQKLKIPDEEKAKAEAEKIDSQKNENDKKTKKAVDACISEVKKEASNNSGGVKSTPMSEIKYSDITYDDCTNEGKLPEECEQYFFTRNAKMEQELTEIINSIAQEQAKKGITISANSISVINLKGKLQGSISLVCKKMNYENDKTLMGIIANKLFEKYPDEFAKESKKKSSIDIFGCSKSCSSADGIAESCSTTSWGIENGGYGSRV